MAPINIVGIENVGSAEWNEMLQFVTSVDGGTSICDCSAVTISCTLLISLCTILNIILNIYRKLMKTGSVMDRPCSGRSRSGKSEENIAAVREAFDLSQGKFIGRASLELDISATFIQRILRPELLLLPKRSMLSRTFNLKTTKVGWKCVKYC